jgi:hypothetical protein
MISKTASPANRQIKISVIGRMSGRTISIPVWFVLDGDKLYLLPVQGSDTQWYKNVLQNPSIRVDARGAAAELKAAPITDANAVASVGGREKVLFEIRRGSRLTLQRIAACND